MIAQIVNGQPVEVTGDITLPNEALISPASVLLWTEGERNAVGLYTVIDPAPPEGQVVAEYGALVFDGETVTREATYTDAPPPPRRLIPKSVVQERVNALGKLGDAFAALNSQPIFFGRWFAPDWPNVYFDDEGLLAILNAIGCTPEEIAEITA